AEAAALEVSSHALDQHRVEGVRFDYAVFTNLSRDHLDYHGDLESYGRAKARLFRWPGLKGAVINVDDAFGAALKTELSGLPEVIGFGQDAAAAVRYRVVEALDAGIQTRFDSPWGSAEVLLPLYGEFSAANAAAAVGTLCLAGFDFADVTAELATLSPVPGRMEFFQGAPALVVDYAHTPDAVAKMLEALKPHTQGRLICLVGCGGDRDPGKRPLMAGAACDHADVVWLTSDNPRSEDPQRILDDMLAGVPDGATIRVEADRRAAIEAAVAEAAPDDLVVIAGKGHERYQEVAGVRRPFDDRALARGLAGISAASREATCCSG
ncbi:MAG: UDP-N-acetylmuramoyl-L-alanyl-D-glutamate--2,6-diaminopimelate ligase, partial [Alphaproteobacteria bacterium]